MTATAQAADRLLVSRRESSDTATWDACVAQSADGGISQLAGWRQIMSDVLGHEVLMLEAHDDAGTRRGQLTLVRIKSALFGHYLVSMPFLNHGGPLGDTAARAALAEFAVDEARRSGADLLELRGLGLPSDSLRTSQRKITVHLPMPEHADALWRSFPAKLRSQIRRPQKDGFETRFGLTECDAFYEVFSRGMRTLGTPTLPRAWFTRIASTFPDQTEFAVVYLGNEPVAAGCGFHWAQSFELNWAASLVAYRRQSPNMLLYWSLMDRVIARRSRTFDFGRCTAGSGTHQFKRQWGGADVPLPWSQWAPGSAVSTPSPDRPAYRLAASVWKQLPLAVTNSSGPWLARGLP